MKHEALIFFGGPDCLHHEHSRRHQPDYLNCAIRVNEYEFDPNVIPHRLQIDLEVSSRSHEPVSDVEITLYAVGGSLPVGKNNKEVASIILRGIISESIPIQKWKHQTIHRSDKKPGWKTARAVEWGMVSERTKGFIIVATLEIPESPGRPRIQPRDDDPAMDPLVAVYCSEFAKPQTSC